jgi:hypothetical protein
MIKPVAYYDAGRVGLSPFENIEVGGRAMVWPITHPDKENVTCSSYVLTSYVVMYNPATKVFETENTRYVPMIK